MFLRFCQTNIIYKPSNSPPDFYLGLCVPNSLIHQHTTILKKFKNIYVEKCNQLKAQFLLNYPYSHVLFVSLFSGGIYLKNCLRYIDSFKIESKVERKKRIDSIDVGIDFFASLIFSERFALEKCWVSYCRPCSTKACCIFN